MIKGESKMDKKPLIGVSICAVVLLVLGSLSIVVGSESVQTCDCGDPPCWPVISGTMGDNNWYVSSVTIVFTGDPVNYVIYRIDGGSWAVYTAPTGLITDGIHVLEWACDSNMSNISSMEIKIDMTTPMFGQYKAKWIGLFQWQLSVNAYDNTSGVNRVLFYLPNSFDTEPPYQVIWKGCYWLFWILSFHYIYYPVNVWDNAENYLSSPSSS